MKERIEELRRWLNEQNRKYYIENAPEVSDFEFDERMHELQRLEAEYPEYADPNSPTNRVGSDLTNDFRTVEHRYPMLSLANTYSVDDLKEFFERVEREVGRVEYVCELKFDGTAISLTYVDGRLSQGVTRGDGRSGDDVTANVRTVRTIPLELSGGEMDIAALMDDADAPAENVCETAETDEELPEYVPSGLEHYIIPEGSQMPPQPRMVTIYIGKGKKDKVSRGDVLGFLCKAGGLDGSSIGRIDVMERWAYAAVDSSRWRDVIERASGAKLKGIKTLIELVK